MEEGFVVVCEPKDEPTANIIRAALEDEGIQVIVNPRHTSWLDGALVPADGEWGQILVPEAQAEKAVEILEDYSEDSTEQEEV